MSPRSGGEAAKLGGHYEAAWTVRMAFEVLHGRADAINLEPDPPVNFGAEFILERADGHEAHQVQRQLGTRSTWLVRAFLIGEDVLAAAAFHAREGREYHFASITPAPRLRELHGTPTT